MTTLRPVRRARELRGFLLATLLVLVLAGCAAPSTSEDPAIVFFYMEDCSHCTRMKEVLQTLLDESPGLAVRYYDFKSSTGQSLLQKLAIRYRLQSPIDVPVILVGDKAIVGEGRTQELALRAAVVACASGDCTSPLR
jgi:glutaredoxin